VIDSGLARIARFDPKRGINMLFAEAISKSSADQRTGRAGRVAPGISVRLWSEFSHEHRLNHNIPEIHRMDLSETILALLAAGEDPELFPWVEAPSGASMESAFRLLHQLGALDTAGKLTSLGYKMAKLRVHPRFARMLTEAELLGCSASAAVLVAITQSSGFMNGSTDPVLRQERLDMFGNCGSDLIFELNAWLWAGSHQFQSEECHRYGINPGKARDIGKLAIQILQKASVKTHALPKDRLSPEESAKLRKCIFEGFSDFLAIRHRPNSPVCQMMYGRSGQLHRDSSVQDSKHMVANENEESKTPTGIQSYLRKVTAIEPEWLTEIFTQNSKSVSYALSKDTGRFLEFIEYSVNQLTISREQNEILDHDIAAGVIAKAIMDGDISFSAWDEEMEHFVRRVNFAALNAPHYQIPAIHEEEKEFIIQQAVYKCRSLNDIQKCAVWPSLKSWLSYEKWKQ
jgi:ATP-dependent helicase HrpB